MGVIRGRHTSPGVYTRLQSGKLVPITSHKSGDGGTAVYNDWNTDKIEHTIWFGYYPAETLNAKEKSTTYDLVKKINEAILNHTNKIFKEFDPSFIITTHNNENILIPEETVTEVNFNTNWENYRSYADKHNQCAVLIVSNNKYQNNQVKVYDSLLYHLGGESENIINKFSPINQITCNGNKYIVLAMLDDNYAYSPLNTDKVLSPVVVIIN